MQAPPPSKILQRMLERLHASLANGPLLQCRPHRSRQRIDLAQLGLLEGPRPEAILPALLSSDRAVKLSVPRESPIPTTELAGKSKDEHQALVARLRTIAEDAKTYEQDTGVHALFVGYPMLHLPPEVRPRSTLPGKRVLAPLAFVPVQLNVKVTRPGSVLIERIADGADLVVPNATLFAWLQQLTGHSFGDLFADEEGADPWRELNDVANAVCRALDIAPPGILDADSPLLPTPRSDGEGPEVRAVTPSAVLGLFPVSKQGLLNDLQALAAGEVPEGPIQSFLRSRAELGLSDAAEVQDTIASERCVGAADPCQLRAVRLARRASGLVVHGPPGTGKSQTITNVIADHLAAGERVLFVCDKRTALDVVHFRMQHLGLGELCAVVHDARRDPRELYRSIREQLDGLPDAPDDPGCGPSLEAADRELQSLHAELAAYTGAIMDRPDPGDASLHELVGQWFGIEVREPWLCELSDLRPADLRELERDSREMLERGVKEDFASNPWTNALGVGLRDFLAHSQPHWHGLLRELSAAAQRLDETTGSELLPFDAGSDIAEQARARGELLGLLLDVRARGAGATLALWAGKPLDHRLSASDDHAAIVPSAQLVAQQPLDRELLAAADSGQLSVADSALWLGKLASYLQVARKWYRFFCFARRREALAVVQRFGYALGYDAALRVQKFLNGFRARKLVQDWYATLSQPAAGRLPPDAELTKAANDYGVIFRLLARVVDEPGLRASSAAILSALCDETRHAELEAALRTSELRARRLSELDTALRRTQLLHADFCANVVRDACAHERVHAEVASLCAAQSSIEGILRIRERLARLPEATRAFQLRLLEESADAEEGWVAVRKAVLCAEITRRLNAEPVLQELDGDRIRATYARYRGLEAQRRKLAARAIVQRWTDAQRARLLAATGSRLNGAGAEVRRRLVSRGERAMRLRQVIATGAAIEGGDPIFDLRPVWMASPEVVAQILPRAPLFDLVVFDEASQCRLEEALPVLTRARRVLIAGDPKQLPPTRFFELAGAQSPDFEAETEQELFEEQQAEVEDLLGAALNLATEQAYLDVHYRSENSDLIEFSNRHFYDARLQAIPGHPTHGLAAPPLRLVHAGGVYDKRVNLAEAREVVRIVRDLLAEPEAPSIGIACFNLSQRDTIVEALDRAAAEDAAFGAQLSAARARRGEASFEGLFVKNLENVQGDERDHIIISTTYGPDPSGRFYRRFGPLGQPGGGRRLNVLVTRARRAVHVVTSIPREIYRTLPAPELGRQPNGAWLLFAYLNYADTLASQYGAERDRRRAANAKQPESRVRDTELPSELACAVGRALAADHALSNEVHWGNDGFSVDIALAHSNAPHDVTLGVLCDATRFDKSVDRVQWDIFRTEILEAQGWNLVRLWTPQFFRQSASALAAIAEQASRRSAELRPARPGREERVEDPLIH